MKMKVAARGSDLSEFEHQYAIASGDREIAVGLTARYGGEWRKRGALISYTFLDKNGIELIPNAISPYSSSAGFYFYLNLQQTEESFLQATVEVLSVPIGAETLCLRGRNWRGGMTIELHDVWTLSMGSTGLTPSLEEGLPEWFSRKIDRKHREPWQKRSRDRAPREPGNTPEAARWSLDKEVIGRPRGMEVNREAYRSHGPKTASRYKVAIICDEFTYNSFAPEFDHVVLEPGTWRQTIEAFNPDIFLCESAWSGADSRRRPWRGQIYNSAKYSHENRGKLLEILAYCREKSIPSVFWNKEDPTHFHDRVNDFVDTAAKFDYVLTTAEEMVAEYEKFMSPDSVGVMQFAVQPRDFNPMPSKARADRAVFAGAWYDIHPARAETMRRGFDWVLQAGKELAIYDRNLTAPQHRTNFPEPYAGHVSAAVSHKATAEIYKNSTIGLNFNTVQDSRTMFARRVFELAASGTLVASNYSPGIERIYGDNVVFFDGDGPRLSELTGMDIAHRTENALRTTLAGHTYRHRFETVLQHLGLPFTSTRPSPTMMVKVATHDEASLAVARFNERNQEFSRLLLVVEDSVQSSRTGRFLADYRSARVDVIAKELVATEKVPSTNFLTTPEVVWTDSRYMPTKNEIRSLLIHGEYSRHPMALSANSMTHMTARSLGPGMRISAVDLVEAINNPGMVRPVLEVASGDF